MYLHHQVRQQGRFLSKILRVLQARASAGRSNTNERPVLPPLTTDTGVDDGENEDNTGTTNENTTQDTAAAGCDSISTEDHQVNAETSAIRLVYVERQLLRPVTQLFCSDCHVYVNLIFLITTKFCINLP